MSLYTMTLHKCDGSTSDVGGPDSAYADLDEARAGAILRARAIMTDEIARGRLCLTCWIVVKNERGHTVLTVPFGDAIEMLDHPECNGATAPARTHPAA